MKTMVTKRVELTERDRELFQSLCDYRYLSMSQVERLHFASAQTAARRVRALSEARYLTAYRGLGIPERIVSLTEAGANLLAESKGVRVCDLGWNSTKRQPQDYLFLKHFLAVTDFRLALSQAIAARTDVSLVGYLPEFTGEQTRSGGVVRRIHDEVADSEAPHPKISHTPDAVFALVRGEQSALFFLEVDRGTEVVGSPERGVGKLVRFYCSYLQGMRYQRYQKEFGAGTSFRGFRTLISASSEARLQSIRERAGPLASGPAHLKRFIWLTAQENVTKEGILTDIWVSLDLEDQTRYRIAP